MMAPMSRIDLSVPFGEKDDAKRLGARWDGERRVWYVPEGLDVSAFGRWLPSESNIIVRSSSYFIAQTVKTCWRCDENTRVFGFILPAGHETFESDDEKYEWCRHDEWALLFYVSYLPAAVAASVNTFSRHYRVDFSKTTQSSYWMNHCEHCGMKQGDFEMYCEPQGAFTPMSRLAASTITLHEFTRSFGCDGSVAYGDYPFNYMRRP